MKINPESALLDYFDIVNIIFRNGKSDIQSFSHVVIWTEQEVSLVSKSVDWDQIQLVEYSWMDTTVKLSPESTENLEEQLEALVVLGFLEKNCACVYEITQLLKDTANNIFTDQAKTSGQKKTGASAVKVTSV